MNTKYFEDLNKSIAGLIITNKALLKRIDVLEAKMTMQIGINENIINRLKCNTTETKP